VAIIEMDPSATVPQLARAARMLRLAESLDTRTTRPGPRRRRRRKASATANQSPAPDQGAK
jgi:hypothetical protein